MAAWGHSLYSYYLKNGGTFRGNLGELDGINSSLELLRDGVRVLLVPQVKSGTDGKYKLEASAQVSAELKSSYALTVSGLGIVAKLTKAFSKQDPEGSATGYAKCDKRLNVVTDNKQYTRSLFANGDFRRAMLGASGMTVKVTPVTGTGLHTVTVSTDIKLGGDKVLPCETLEKMVTIACLTWHTMAKTGMEQAQ